MASNFKSPLIGRHSHDDFEHRSAHPHHPRIPGIPDLRFEYSYLRSIQPYITIHCSREGEESSRTGIEKVGYEEVGGIDDEEQERRLEITGHEVIKVQWGRVAWVTARDQVISPLLQGLLWAIVSYYLKPFSARLGSQMGTLAHSRLPPPKEGTGAGWLRHWASRLGLGGTATGLRRSS